MLSVATTTETEPSQFLLPVLTLVSDGGDSSSSSTSSPSPDTTTNTPPEKKKRRKPELLQEELFVEMQLVLQEMRKRMLQLIATSTKAKVTHGLIRDKKRIQTQKRKQKKWNQWKKKGSCSDLSYYHIHPDLASLLQIPPNTFVRREDVRTLVAAYVRKNRLAKQGIQVELSEELKKVIGPSWTEKIQEGKARFTNFTFEQIAKERNLFGEKAPTPGTHQTYEIFSALGYFD
jgi:hypothetical protein